MAVSKYTKPLIKIHKCVGVATGLAAWFAHCAYCPPLPPAGGAHGRARWLDLVDTKGPSLVAGNLVQCYPPNLRPVGGCFGGVNKRG